jgi:hypothetical protein
MPTAARQAGAAVRRGVGGRASAAGTGRRGLTRVGFGHADAAGVGVIGLAGTGDAAGG